MEYQFFITGEIGVSFDWWTGSRGTTAKDVRNFLNTHKDEEVHIAVSSPGGYVDAGLEIYQLIKDHGKVHMHILGMTASAATFLTMGAKTVDMVDGSLMLIHNTSMAVIEWQSANKEQLDALIEKYKKEREDLNTIDKVIASLYAKKSGKTLDECMEKMSKASWLSPQDALDFGLIDCIREDEHGVLKKKNFNNISNKIIKEYGLPPFPKASNSAVADENGNPTKSFILKSVEAMKSFFHHDPALNNFSMIKIWKNVENLLAVKDGFIPNDDGSISLSQEQMQQVDNRLGSLELEVKNEKEVKDSLQSQLDDVKAKLEKAQNDLTSANETIDNLKQAPGGSTLEKPVNNEMHDKESDFLDEARASYERIKDL